MNRVEVAKGSYLDEAKVLRRVAYGLDMRFYCVCVGVGVGVCVAFVCFFVASGQNGVCVCSR